jgi:RluA family pseudouridine synthase
MRYEKNVPKNEFGDWILWQDEFLVAVDKPAGVLSQGGSAGDNLVDLARAHFGMSHIGVLHRLDRNVSGIVLLALDSRAARGLSDALARQEVEREYEAVVRGKPSADAFVIDASLEKDERSNTVAVSTTKGAKPARTDVRVERRFRAPLGNCAVLSVQPITGRSHQIRVHLAHMGLPIIGDPKYGAAARGIHRPLLHARRMKFAHPMTGVTVEVDSHPPWREADLVVLRRS